jgi:hypothetical protein
VGRQAFNLAGGKFKIGKGQVVRRHADPGEQTITPRLWGRLASREEQIVRARGEDLAYPYEGH